MRVYWGASGVWKSPFCGATIVANILVQIDLQKDLVLIEADVLFEYLGRLP